MCLHLRDPRLCFGEVKTQRGFVGLQLLNLPRQARDFLPLLHGFALHVCDLAAQGFVWVVGTITSELRHLFMRIGVTPLALGVADPAALGAEVTHWGTYYDHRPVVLAGHLHQALRRLARGARNVKPTP